MFHSIVLQYLPDDSRRGMKAALRQAGEGATAEAPLTWLRMEPAGGKHADLRLTSWPGGAEEVLATSGFHGADIRWAGAPDEHEPGELRRTPATNVTTLEPPAGHVRVAAHRTSATADPRLW